MLYFCFWSLRCLHANDKFRFYSILTSWGYCRQYNTTYMYMMDWCSCCSNDHYQLAAVLMCLLLTMTWLFWGGGGGGGGGGGHVFKVTIILIACFVCTNLCDLYTNKYRVVNF